MKTSKSKKSSPCCLTSVGSNGHLFWFLLEMVRPFAHLEAVLGGCGR